MRIGSRLPVALLVTGGLTAQSEVAASLWKQLRDDERAVTKAWEAKFMAFVTGAARAKKTGETPPERPAGLSLLPFVPRHQAAAEEFQGTDDAIPFLVWLAAYGGQWNREAGRAAVDTLIRSHASSPRIVSIGEHLDSQLPDVVGRESTDRLIRELRAKNKAPELTAWLGWLDHGRALETQPVTSDAYRRARTALRAIAATAKDPKLVGRIRKLIAKRERPAIGSVAPDIAGVDLDGQRFKLSDYKGRIVLLDFWGDW